MRVRWCVQLLLIVISIQACTSLARNVKLPEVEQQPTRLLVKYKQGKEPEPGRKGSKKLRGPRLYREDRRSNETVTEALRRFKNDPNVEVAEPDYIVNALANVNDPYFDIGYQWALTAGHMNAKAAWDITTGSKNVRVCVIDSGIQRTHEDLTANVVAGYDAIKDVAGDTVDGDGHGTHCSGVIGATSDNSIGIAGLNQHVTIIPCKFLGPTGSGSTSDAIECIDWCSTTGAAKILSNSWAGSASSSLLVAAINRSVARGSLFVVAAGNNGANNDVATSNYPAKYNLPGMIAVAATTEYKTLAYFSAYGATTTHIGAPGESIVSTVPGVNGPTVPGYGDCYGSALARCYAYYDGTSMAAPQVAGVAAMIWAVNPALTVTQVRDIILTNVDASAGLVGLVSSGGILSAFKAVKAASLTACAYNGQYRLESVACPGKYLSTSTQCNITRVLLGTMASAPGIRTKWAIAAKARTFTAIKSLRVCRKITLASPGVAAKSQPTVGDATGRFKVIPASSNSCTIVNLMAQAHAGTPYLSTASTCDKFFWSASASGKSKQFKLVKV